MTQNIKYLFLSFLFIAISCQQRPQKKEENIKPKLDEISTYYFIRHAEKDTSDTGNRNPALTEIGKERAENETGKPTAESKGLKVQIYDHTKLNSDAFKKATKGKKVLVVGHTNTTPYFANAVFGEEIFKNDIDESQHGKLFIVQVNPNGENRIENLTIN